MLASGLVTQSMNDGGLVMMSGPVIHIAVDESGNHALAAFLVTQEMLNNLVDSNMIEVWGFRASHGCVLSAVNVCIAVLNLGCR